jgi:hypothetical protein
LQVRIDELFHRFVPRFGHTLQIPSTSFFLPVV